MFTSAILVLSILILLSSNKFSLNTIKKIDQTYFDEKVRNFYGRLVGENWDVNLNVGHYNLSSSEFISIAHALGFRNSSLENKKEAQKISRTFGFKIFELDVYLHDNKLYCVNNFQNESFEICSLARYFDQSFPDELFIVDIKSDFAETLAFLANDPALDDITQRFVVQIYHPDQVIDYWKFRDKFNSYLFTLYKSHRHLEYICPHLNAHSIPHVVISSKRLEKAKNICPGLKFIVHPVNTCPKLKNIIEDPLAIGAMISGSARLC